MRRRRTRKNPAADILAASIAPLLPYAVVGVVIYFWGDKIAKGVASKITGRSPQEYDMAIRTIKSATVGEALRGTAGLLTFGIYDPSNVSYTTQTKFTIDMIKLAVDKGWVKQSELPYPTAKSVAELNANRAFINSPAMVARRSGK